MKFLIGYDIRDPRRLGRVHREIRKHAMPIGYSVFLLDGSKQDVLRCLAALEEIMDKSTDDIRCYALPQRGLQKRLGKAILPEGITFTSVPDALL